MMTLCYIFFRLIVITCLITCVSYHIKCQCWPHIVINLEKIF